MTPHQFEYVYQKVRRESKQQGSMTRKEFRAFLQLLGRGQGSVEIDAHGFGNQLIKEVNEIINTVETQEAVSLLDLEE